MFRISDDIYFRLYGEFTYVRSVIQRRDYLFNEIVYDILSFIEIHPDCTLEELAASLRAAYEINDCSFESDIADFTATLLQNGIIFSDSDENEAHTDRIRDIVHGICSSAGGTGPEGILPEDRMGFSAI